MREREEFLGEMAAFWDAYDRLSEDGHCDGVGGGEFTRVLGEWVDLYPSEKPTGSELDEYIQWRANFPSPAFEILRERNQFIKTREQLEAAGRLCEITGDDGHIQPSQKAIDAIKETHSRDNYSKERALAEVRTVMDLAEKYINNEPDKQPSRGDDHVSVSPMVTVG